jgi:multidrug resistance efflux pump
MDPAVGSKPDLDRLVEAVRLAEAALDAAKGRTATNEAVKKLQQAREELASAKAGVRTERVRKPRGRRSAGP